MYEGYRIKINGTEVPNMLISSGSYSFKNTKRVINKYTDGNGKEHVDYYKNKKAVINFSIRKRNLEEHKSICNIFTLQENVPVTYWDDYECKYKEGKFKMNDPLIKHTKAVGTDIFYQSTAIILEEY